MAVRALVSTVSEIAGMPGRSRSKRPTIAAAKCWLSAAEPPLPQENTLGPAGTPRGGDGLAALHDVGGQRLRHALAQLDAFLEMRSQVGDEIHARFYQAAS